MVAIADRPRRIGVQYFCQFHLSEVSLCAALIRLMDLNALDSEGEALARQIEIDFDKEDAEIAFSDLARSQLASAIGQGCYRLNMRTSKDLIIGLSRL